MKNFKCCIFHYQIAYQKPYCVCLKTNALCNSCFFSSLLLLRDIPLLRIFWIDIFKSVYYKVVPLTFPATEGSESWSGSDCSISHQTLSPTSNFSNFIFGKNLVRAKNTRRLWIFGALYIRSSFLMYANDPSSASYLLNTIMFSDDTNLFFEHSYIKVLFSTVNRELQNINEWFIRNKLSLNVQNEI